ncbi:MAG: hypothetical protein JWP03_3550 [Phycisphaerales bacterium]|nr:hypothetical protein [Phycisphaerales bacterium]
MDGTAAACELTAAGESPEGGGIRFTVATAAHDAGIRRLLRDNPMRGRISVSLEREPSYFRAARIEGPEHRTIIALDEDRVICTGSVSVRERFINGRPMPVGYLGGLRLDRSCRGRTSVIRRGYELLRTLHEQGGPPIYFTSIVADNLPARRLLERGLPGMPTYRFLGEFVTLIIRASSPRAFFSSLAPALGKLRAAGQRLVNGSDENLSAIVELLNRTQVNYQFAPVWSVEALRSPAKCPGLRAEDFQIAFTSDGAAGACAAVWDQRSVKQTVVRDYSPGLRQLRPLLNIGAAILGGPRLPVRGRALPQAFASHVVVDPNSRDLLQQLIQALCGVAHARGIEYLITGFDARDARLAPLRKAFRPREYVSRLYAVHWEDGEELARGLDGRLLAPEVALL